MFGILAAAACAPTVTQQAADAPTKNAPPVAPKTTASAPVAAPAVPGKATTPGPSAVAEEAPADFFSLPLEPAPWSVVERYPELAIQPLAADCKQPYVLAATAPKKVLKDDSWFWPWVTQALVAHDRAFRIVTEQGLTLSRGVFFTTRDLDKKTIGSVVRCHDAETCNALARVLRAVIPNNQATLGCGEPPGTVMPEWVLSSGLANIPSPEPGAAASVPGTSCARLAACALEQEPSVDPKKFLGCQAKPAGFPLQCASQSTCYSVALCAGYSATSLDFSPWGDGAVIESELTTYSERLLGFMGVSDAGAGGLQDPTQILVPLGIVPSTRGVWVAVASSVSLAPADPETGEVSNGSATWHPAFVDRHAHVTLGPAQVTHGSAFSSTNVPSNTSAFGHSSQFDFNGDGFPELLLHTVDGHHSGSGARHLSLWTFDGRTVTRYAGTEGLPIIHAEDVDGDGRPDLILDYDNTTNDEGTSSSLTPGNWKLAHSLPNGTFSTTDAVARGYDSSDGQ